MIKSGRNRTKRKNVFLAMLRKLPRNCELIEGSSLLVIVESGGIIMEVGLVAVVGIVIVAVSLLSSGMISSDVEGTGIARTKMKRVIKTAKYFPGGIHVYSSFDLFWKNK